jgi:uncharacterized protein (TIRG00374 family)
MDKKTRKTLLLIAKIVVAIGLVAFVVMKVRWRDYATSVAGKDTEIFGQQQTPDGPAFLVKDSAGQLQPVPARNFRPISAQTPDGKSLLVRDASPTWADATKYLVKHTDGREEWIDRAALEKDRVQYHCRGFVDTVTHADGWLLAASAVCFMIPMLVLSVRWWFLLRIQEVRIPLWESVRLTFLGAIFNYIVPGSVSGDLVKAYYVSKHTHQGAGVLVSVFLDRAVGLLEFAVLPAVVIAVMYAGGMSGGAALTFPAIMIAAVLVAVFVSLSLLLSARLRQILHVRAIVSRLPLQKHIDMMAQVARMYRRRLLSLVQALGITFGGQFFFITAIMLAGLALHLTMIPWYYYFLYVPMISIIAAVPVSPGGLGLTETFYVLFFTPSGAAASEVVALALAARLIPMLCSLPGLVVALTGPKLPKAADMQAELDSPQP